MSRIVNGSIWEILDNALMKTFNIRLLRLYVYQRSHKLERVFTHLKRPSPIRRHFSAQTLDIPSIAALSGRVNYV